MTNRPSSSVVASLQISVLGTFRLAVNGEVVEEKRWARRKAQQLVKLLALQPDARLHREQVSEWLFPELEAEEAAANLYRALHYARRALEPHATRQQHSAFICISQQQLQLGAPNGLLIDWQEFARLAADATRTGDPSIYEQAIQLYAGELLPGDVYEDWTTVRREQLRVQHRDLLCALARIYERVGETRRGIECLKKLLTLDLSDEACHRELMRLYAAMGDRERAVLQYRLCRDALRQELDAPPEAATEKLYREISGDQSVPSGGDRFDVIGNARDRRAVSECVASVRAADNLPVNDRRKSVLNASVALHAPPIFHQLTFRTGTIRSARAGADGKNIFFAASWSGEPVQIYRTRTDTRETTERGYAGAGVLAAARDEDVFLSLERRFKRGYVNAGKLARVNLAQTNLPHGDACSPASDVSSADASISDVQWADYCVAQNRLLIVRDCEGFNCLESPPGRILYRTGGWISHPRFAPDGKRIAFIDHPIPTDDGGRIVLLEEAGKVRVLAGNWLSAQGLAWHPDGDEVWFTATRAGVVRQLFAVTTDGRERLVERVAGSLTLHEMFRVDAPDTASSADVRALVSRDTTRLGIICLARDAVAPRNLSLLDWSLARDISTDGRTLLFTEAGEGSGENYTVYLRRIDESGAVKKLGKGSALALSPDGRFVLANNRATPPQLVLLPTDDNLAQDEQVRLPVFAGIYQPRACWFPDGRRILFVGSETGRGAQLYVQRIPLRQRNDGDKNGDAPVSITPRMDGVSLTSTHAISPDGKWIAAIAPDGTSHLFPTSGKGKPLALPQLKETETVVRWNVKGDAIYIFERGELPARMELFNLKTGRRKFICDLAPADLTGVHEILTVLFTPDLKSYAYTYTHQLSELYLVEGLR